MQPYDPRGKGFGDRATLAELEQWIDAACHPLAPVELPVGKALGSVLAADVPSPATLPARPVAAFDGWAVRAEESYGASTYNPLMLQLAGREGALPVGSTMKVAAGRGLPDGADAVLDFAEAELVGGMVELLAQAAPGEGVVRAGQDAMAGQVMLAAGRRLRAADCALASVAGLETLAVHPVPRVFLISAGRFQGPDLMPLLLDPLIRRDGGRVGGHAAVEDGDALAAALRQAEADLIVIAGGSGLDTDDRAALVLAEIGTLARHGLALRPGDTSGYGAVGDTPVLLLPGSPGALRLAWEVTGARAVRRMAGLGPTLPLPRRTLPLAHKVASEVGWDEVLPARVTKDGTIALTAREVAGLGALARADGFILVPADGEGYPEGTGITIHLFDC
ncbi:molybdopterin molybdotransferase MoeA [Indioceanicola profundi]|uniref:molybdopterin molybdotransferase MoeA n=1 Tax=Indioceanicola profundi TaxID=2220096 RepID=UPI000E6A9973|nr:molybdopterin-binding protein [Indioceanicola profundi]